MSRKDKINQLESLCSAEIGVDKKLEDINEMGRKSGFFSQSEKKKGNYKL